MKNGAHPSRLRQLPNLLGAAALLATWGLGDGGLFLLLCFAAWIAASEHAGRFFSAPGPTPYRFMLFSPLLLVHYASIGDFRIRLACFFMLTYVMALALRVPGRRPKPLMPVTGPRQAWVLALLTSMLAAFLLHAQGIQLSGDEPHYVMIAQSLVEDGDFDLKNNLEQKTYFSYLPVELRFHGAVVSGRYRSFHLPGLSFLLVPFFFLFKLLGGLLPASLYFRLAAALINSLFSLGLFLVLRHAWPEKDNGACFFFFLCTFPLCFHAVHLFPELPAAALTLYAYILGRDHRRYALAGLLLAGTAWLHLKYSIPALVLALFLGARAWKEGGPRLKRLARLLAAPALSLALLGLYSRILYGSFDPRVISPEKNFLAIPLHFRIETLLSFFLDQRDGLLVYAPLFLLLFLAWRKDIRTAIRDFGLLSALLVSYILFHAFTTVRGGYSPAARPVVFVLWILCVFLVAVHRNSASGLLRILSRMLAGMTAFATVWLLYYPLFLYQPVTREVSQRASSLLWFLSSEAIDLASLFPSFLKQSNAGYWPNWAWLGALAVALAVYYSKSARPFPPRALRGAFVALGLGLMFLLSYFPHVLLQTRHATAGLSFFCQSRNFVFRPDRGAFRVLAGQNYDLYIDLKGSAASKLDLHILDGDQLELKVRNGKHLLLEARRSPRKRLALPLNRLKRFSLAKRELIHLGLETRGLAPQTMFWLEFR